MYLEDDGVVYVLVKPRSLMAPEVALAFTPARDKKNRKLSWTCAGVGVEKAAMPKECS